MVKKSNFACQLCFDCVYFCFFFVLVIIKFYKNIENKKTTTRGDSSRLKVNKRCFTVYLYKYKFWKQSLLLPEELLEKCKQNIKTNPLYILYMEIQYIKLYHLGLGCKFIM